MTTTTVQPYAYTKWLVVAAVLGILGQLTGVLFMTHATPYTTIAFIGPGMGLITMAIVIFAYVVYRDAKRRAESISSKTFTAGERIFRQGDPGDRVYFIKSGEVEIYREDKEKGETILARLRDGEYFGEMALLTDAPRNASARAGTKTEVLSIERDDFQTLFSGIPAFRSNIEAVMKQRA